MRRIVLLFLSFLLTENVCAQSSSLQGMVVDSSLQSLPFVTVSLLYPEDSTLAYFGVTDSYGKYSITNIREGSYLFVSSLLGYKSFRKTLKFPLDKGTLDVRMTPRSTLLREAEIVDERIPVIFKNDTIEYDGAAYRVNPDADAEDLLKKMPGIEVDKSGNVKAQGEEVKSVLVDGKEFFGNDPKVATRNIPADAVNKVQVFDKKSEEEQLTGISEGKGDKTINLVLKDDKKHAWFGEIKGGYGTDEHYLAGAKAFRFTDKVHLSFLGIANNINQYGFSFKDYLDFNGGFGAMMGDDENVNITIEDDGSTPIDFGQNINGLVKSGAGGVNFAYEKKKNNRVSFSYLGNGINKSLLEDVKRWYGIETGGFEAENTSSINSTDYAHRFNFGLKNKADSIGVLTANGNLTITGGEKTGNYFSSTTQRFSILNTAIGYDSENKNGLSGSGHLAYLKRFTSSLRLVKLFADVNGTYLNSKLHFENNSFFSVDSSANTTSRNQNSINSELNISGGGSATFHVSGNLYFDAKGGFGKNTGRWNRNETVAAFQDSFADSLSPVIDQFYTFVRPNLVLRKSTAKINWSISFQLESGLLENEMNYADKISRRSLYYLPVLRWENEYAKGRRLLFYYDAKVSQPKAQQLDPVVRQNLALQSITGNRNLKDEVKHSLFANWFIFDQFSFTSYMANINFNYTKDKIQYARSIDSLYKQSLMLENVPQDYQLRGALEYSTPIRKLGASIEFSADENWNRGFSTINQQLNRYDAFTHTFSLTVNNRKKKYIDISAGVTARFSNSQFDLEKELSSKYQSMDYGTDISITPSESWTITSGFTYTVFTGSDFDQKVEIPLLKASLTYRFMKSKRAALSIDAFDLFDKNKGFDRVSRFNYVEETKSNSIGRYFMISLKIRLSKFQPGDGVDVKIVR